MFIDNKLTEADAKNLGWKNLQELVDYVSRWLNVDEATARKAMEEAPDKWRNHPELKRN